MINRLCLILVGTPLLILLPASGSFAARPQQVSFQEGVHGYIGAHDSYITPSDQTANFGNEPAAAQVAASPNRLKVFVRFSNILGTAAGQIPPSARILTARLEVYCHETIPPGGVPGPITQVVGAYDLLQVFNENEVTWIQRVTGIEWNSHGAEAASDIAPFDSSYDRRATPAAEVTVDTTVTATCGFHSWNVSKSLQQQIDGGKEYGWTLISREDDEDFSRWVMSEHPDQNLRPRLTVRFK